MDCWILAFLAVILLVARVQIFVDAGHEGGGDFIAWIGERHEVKRKGGFVVGDMAWLDWKAKEVTSKLLWIRMGVETLAPSVLKRLIPFSGTCIGLTASRIR